MKKTKFYSVLAILAIILSGCAPKPTLTLTLNVSDDGSINSVEVETVGEAVVVAIVYDSDTNQYAIAKAGEGFGPTDLDFKPLPTVETIALDSPTIFILNSSKAFLLVWDTSRTVQMDTAYPDHVESIILEKTNSVGFFDLTGEELVQQLDALTRVFGPPTY